MAGSRSFTDKASAVSYARHLRKQGYIVRVVARDGRYIVVAD